MSRDRELLMGEGGIAAGHALRKWSDAINSSEGEDMDTVRSPYGRVLLADNVPVMMARVGQLRPRVEQVNVYPI